MKHVLLITYSFPPIQTIAAVRPEGLATYLPEFGWQPVILTPALPAPPDKRFQVIETSYKDRAKAIDDSLKTTFDRSGKQRLYRLFRTKQNEQLPIVKRGINIAGEILSYPDGKKGFIPGALLAAKDIFGKQQIDAVISSSPPVSLHLTAKKIKETYQVPWIADFRDLWTKNPYYPYSRARKFFDERLEKNTLSKADALVTTSSPWAEELKKLHNHPYVRTIENGYKPETVELPKLTQTFSITYAGSLYDGKRDPEQLFIALKNLIGQGKIDRNDVDVRFYGRHQAWLEEKIRRHEMAGVAVQHGMITRDESKRKQRESQLLLLLCWNSPKETGTYTGKVFEYLASGRPILAVGAPKGVVTDLLDETGAGKYAFSVEDLMAVILDYYNRYTENGAISACEKTSEIEKYSHREMAHKFSNILNDITSQR